MSEFTWSEYTPLTPAQVEYCARVIALEEQGMTTSDAQGVADAEVLQGLLADPHPRIVLP